VGADGLAGTARSAAGADRDCTLEKDGAPVEAAAWQKAWRDLPGAFRRAWNGSTTSGRGLSTNRTRGSRSRLRRWSARRHHLGLEAHLGKSVAMRTEGALDPARSLPGAAPLSGELVEGSARARIRVHCKGRSELRMSIAQLGAKGGRKAATSSRRCELALPLHPRDRSRSPASSPRP
jgi:hypothetical protein